MIDNLKPENSFFWLSTSWNDKQSVKKRKIEKFGPADPCGFDSAVAQAFCKAIPMNTYHFALWKDNVRVADGRVNSTTTQIRCINSIVFSYFTKNYAQTNTQP